MTTIKKVVAAILAAIAGAAFHNFCLSLVAGILVPDRSLRRSAFVLAFFAVVAMGGAAGAAKLWGRWRVVFGWWAIVTAFMTGQLTMTNQPGPAPSPPERAAAYVTVALVIAAGAIVLIQEQRRSNRR